VSNRLKGRVDKLSGGPACPVCGGGGSEPPEYRVTMRGLPPKHGAEAAEENPTGPERCPACNRTLRLKIKVPGLDEAPQRTRGGPLVRAVQDRAARIDH
jgi:hypothetical protein